MIKLFTFLRKPNCPESFSRIEWSDFFTLLLIFYLIEMPLGITIKLLINVLGLELKQIPFPYLKKILFALVIAPFFEEILVRINLVFSKRNLLIFLITCFGLAIYFFLKGRDLKLILFILMFLIFIIILINYNYCKLFFIRNFSFFFYFTAILFGLIHIFNFNGISEANFIWTPIIVIPQIIMGFLLGYVRVVYGFIYAVLFHSCINLPILFTFMA
jgi:membrane protease YdiL (CAAX protease family)